MAEPSYVPCSRCLWNPPLPNERLCAACTSPSNRCPECHRTLNGSGLCDRCSTYYTESESLFSEGSGLSPTGERDPDVDEEEEEEVEWLNYSGDTSHSEMFRRIDDALSQTHSEVSSYESVDGTAHVEMLRRLDEVDEESSRFLEIIDDYEEPVHQPSTSKEPENRSLTLGTRQLDVEEWFDDLGNVREDEVSFVVCEYCTAEWDGFSQCECNLGF